MRDAAEQGLWQLWTRSDGKAISALMAKGVGEMQAHALKDATATFSEIIKRKPMFAEGWNRTTALFLAGNSGSRSRIATR